MMRIRFHVQRKFSLVRHYFVSTSFLIPLNLNIIGLHQYLTITAIDLSHADNCLFVFFFFAVNSCIFLWYVIFKQLHVQILNYVNVLIHLLLGFAWVSFNGHSCNWIQLRIRSPKYIMPLPIGLILFAYIIFAIASELYICWWLIKFFT